MIIDELIKVTNSKPLNVIKRMIELNTFVTISKIREKDKRSYYVLCREIDELTNCGILLHKLIPLKIGRNKAKIYHNHYKINKNNKIVKVLMK